MLRAVIFDMDGVICDSEPLHMRAFQKVLSEEGISLLDQEYYDKYLAFDDRGCFQAAFKEKGKPMTPEKLNALLDRKARFFDAEMKEHLVIYPGAESLVKKLSAQYPCAVASGARRLEIEFVLKKAKIRGQFTAVVSADDVSQGKPHPESFQKALKLLNDFRLDGTPEIRPAEVAVIEDSRHGLHAARAAGMVGVGVTTSFKADELKPFAADVVDSLVKLSAETLEKLFL